MKQTSLTREEPDEGDDEQGRDADEENGGL